MKSTKIGMGLGTLAVAIFMAFAFTAAPSTVPSWYIPNGGGCEQHVPLECDQDSSLPCTDASIPATNKNAFADPDCTNPLRKEAGF